MRDRILVHRTRASGMRIRETSDTTSLKSAGMTFGTISALFGLPVHIVDQITCTILVMVVVLSAVIPARIAMRFVGPIVNVPIEAEEVEAAEEIGGEPLPRPRTQEDGTSAIALPAQAAGESA